MLPDLVYAITPKGSEYFKDMDNIKKYNDVGDHYYLVAKGVLSILNENPSDIDEIHQIIGYSHKDIKQVLLVLEEAKYVQKEK